MKFAKGIIFPDILQIKAEHLPMLSHMRIIIQGTRRSLEKLRHMTLSGKTRYLCDLIPF